MTKKFIGGVTIETDKEMKKRHPADFYPTEQALLDAYFSQSFINYVPKLTIDVGAADGRWGTTFNKYNVTDTLIGIELRDYPKPKVFDYWHSGAKDYKADIYNLYSTLSIYSEIPDLFIGNPPFSIVMDIFALCVNAVNKKRGCISFLLPLNWLASEKRGKLFMVGDELKHPVPISRINVCNTRPSFTENGKTYPGKEYMIAEWHFVNGECLSSKDYVKHYGQSPINHLTYKREKHA